MSATSEEYLINCHVLLKRVELIFIQLQLVKMSGKLLVIWVNYEKTNRGFSYRSVRGSLFHIFRSLSKNATVKRYIFVKLLQK